MNKDGRNDTALMANEAINIGVGTGRAFPISLARFLTSLAYPLSSLAPSPLSVCFLRYWSRTIAQQWCTLKRGEDWVHHTCSTSMLFPMLEAVMSPLYLRNVEIQSLRVGNTWYVMEWLWSISSWGNIRHIHSLHHIPYLTNILTKLNLHTSLFLL